MNYVIQVINCYMMQTSLATNYAGISFIHFYHPLIQSICINLDKNLLPLHSVSVCLCSILRRDLVCDGVCANSKDYHTHTSRNGSLSIVFCPPPRWSGGIYTIPQAEPPDSGSVPIHKSWARSPVWFLAGPWYQQFKINQTTASRFTAF